MSGSHPAWLRPTGRLGCGKNSREVKGRGEGDSDLAKDDSGVNKVQVQGVCCINYLILSHTS